MEKNSKIFQSNKYKNKQRNNLAKKRYPFKKKLIIKNEKVKVKFFDTYIEVYTKNQKEIFGVLNIAKIYININIPITIKQCYKISQYVPIYFIDGNNVILGKFKRYNYE